jgi:phage terminase small subunit
MLRDKKKLTPKRERFVDEYLIDLNATRAYKAAGYKVKKDIYARVEACRLLTNPYVAEAIQKRRRKLQKKAGLTQEKVIKELMKLGFANMADYMRVTKDGDPYLDFSQLTRKQTAALQEVTIEDFIDGRREDARDVKRVKFKLYDKRAALVDLGNHLGLFVDRHEVTGAGGMPLIPSDPYEKLAQVLLKLGITTTRRNGQGRSNGGSRPSKSTSVEKGAA